MAYTILSSEKLRKSASDAETKALLYLMNFHEESNEIYYFVVDFFNDLTGMNKMSRKLWDLQSKGASNSSPKAIGKELVTLYKNYVSELVFDRFILFLGGVSNTVRIDSNKNVFNISNIKEKALLKIKEGLVEECTDKTYINKADIDESRIEEFLNLVLFVIDDKSPSEYVRPIIKIHPKIMPSDASLLAIFNEIRDQQAGKKNTIPVEGITIETTDQALNHFRHLTSGEIKLFVIGRIINRNPFDKGCPIPFIPIYTTFPAEKRQEALEDCKIALSRALFNKNCADSFWSLFAEIYKKIISNPNGEVEKIFTLLDKDIVDDCPDFDVLSLKYFIATVKEGIQE